MMVEALPGPEDGYWRVAGGRGGEIQVAVVGAVGALRRPGEGVDAGRQDDRGAGAAGQVGLHHRRAQGAGVGGGVAETVGGVVVDLVQHAVDGEGDDGGGSRRTEGGAEAGERTHDCPVPRAEPRTHRSLQLSRQRAGILSLFVGGGNAAVRQEADAGSGESKPPDRVGGTSLNS